MNDKLTRKECEDALMDICHGKNILESIHILHCLVKEHFDNPPLKFDDLKEGMWVWDNKFRVYNQIHKLYGKIMHTKHNVVMFNYINETTQWGTSIEFEENRFYRKQVEE